MLDRSSCGVDFLLFICLLFVLEIDWKNSARPFHIQGGSLDWSWATFNLIFSDYESKESQIVKEENNASREESCVGG